MEYNDTNAEEWKKHFRLEEDLAKRNPAQFERYKDNMRGAYERKNENRDSEEGDGLLSIEWKR